MRSKKDLNMMGKVWDKKIFEQIPGHHYRSDKTQNYKYLNVCLYFEILI